MQKAVIVIPTYNEGKNIEKLIEAIFNETSGIKAWEVHVLIVDSKSPDKTAEKVRTLTAKYPLLHILVTEKEGLGKAYLRGFTEAIETHQADVVFEMDGDFSHDPSDIKRFLKEIDKGAEFVIGTRYSKGGSIPADWGLERKIMSLGANVFIRFGFLKLKNTEWTNGFRAIRREIVEKVVPQMSGYTGYVFQVAFLDKTLAIGAKIAEVPVHFVDRTHGVSKINAPQYILQTFWYVITHSSFIKFAIVGGIGALVDFSVAYIMNRGVGATVLVANAVSTEVAVVSNYLLNNFWSFQDKKIESSLIAHISAFLKFNLVSLGNIVIQLIGIYIGISLFGEGAWLLAKLLTIVFVVIPYSYLFYNKVIWKKK